MEVNTNDQKFEIIEASKKPGFKAEDIRKKYGISRTCIFTLLRQKDDFVEKMVFRLKPGFKVQSALNPILEIEHSLDLEHF